jgi:predicted nucleotidyltransferase
VYGDLDEMLESPDVHVVDITGYPDQHASQFIRALQAGKHVIVEKPLAIEWSEILAMRSCRIPAKKLYEIVKALIYREVGQPMVNKRLGINDERLVAFCAKHHITRLALFGSVLAGRDQRLSDVDLLIEFEPGRAPGVLALSGMEAELSVLLDGRRVDLRSLPAAVKASSGPAGRTPRVGSD